MSADQDEAAGREADAAAAQAGPAPGAGSVGWCRPPVASRFRPGRSGNPRGRPRRARHLGALVAAALSERVAVAEDDGRVRRLTKLEATVRRIVDGAASGDARSIKLLFALIRTDERALAEPEPHGARGREAADALVVAELLRRLGGGRAPEAGRADAAPADGASAGASPAPGLRE